VVILHVYKIWNWLLLNLSREGYMRSMQWQLGILGTISAFALRHGETKKNLCRGGRSQDLRKKWINRLTSGRKFTQETGCSSYKECVKSIKEGEFAQLYSTYRIYHGQISAIWDAGMCVNFVGRHDRLCSCGMLPQRWPLRRRALSKFLQFWFTCGTESHICG